MTALERQARDQAIAHDYTKEGLTLTEIGEKYRLAPSRAQQILAARGLTARDRAGVGSEADQKALAARAAHLYTNEGLSQREVAARLSLSKTGARDLLILAGVKFRPAVTPKDTSKQDRNALMVALYDAGAASTVLGRVFGLTPERVRGVVLEAGRTLRPRGARTRLSEAAVRARYEDSFGGAQRELPFSAPEQRAA